MNRIWMLCAAVSVLAAAPVSASGLVCGQACLDGVCEQAGCALQTAGDGACRCAAGSTPWNGGVYASWCRSTQPPDAGRACPPTPTAEDLRNGPPLLPPGQPDLRLARAEALSAALALKNPYLSTLVTALLDGDAWAGSTVDGLIHDSSADPGSDAMLHSPAIPFTARVLPAGLGAAQLQITLAGDLGSLPALKAAVRATAPAAVVPASVTGTVIDGGGHGTLVAVAASGITQTVQW